MICVQKKAYIAVVPNAFLLVCVLGVIPGCSFDVKQYSRLVQLRGKYCFYFINAPPIP